VHRYHDLKRLDDGEDLNDALLDFFVKLGQAVIPCGGLEGGFPSIAYLGSLFYDVLRKGGVSDGRSGHANVANWARRRLGNGGLFFDGIGALAVPVNETLRDRAGRAAPKEKHWWLALLLNPRAGSKPQGEEDVSLVCLDSVARMEVKSNPPVKALKRGSQAYTVEVASLYRQGFAAFVRFRALGDGSQGALPDPRSARLRANGREWTKPQASLAIDQRGSFGVPGRMEGILEFTLDSEAQTVGDYIFEFGDPGTYAPTLVLTIKREPDKFQKEVTNFLAGYVAKEWEVASVGEGTTSRPRDYSVDRLEGRLCMPDVPQQETANDCGFFILAQILLVLQLTPEGLRVLAGASADKLTALPWPTQKEVTRRKAKLRDAMVAMFETADDMLCDDVDMLLKKSPSLRSKVQAAMWDGPQFAEAVRRLAAASAPKQEFSISELGTMSTKALRTLCAQRGVLPPGMVERSDLLKALIPTTIRAATISDVNGQARGSSPPAGTTNGNSSACASSTKRPNESAGVAPEPPAKQTRLSSQNGEEPHLGNLRFSSEDLETMPLKRLRGLCVQHKCMPSCALERGDFMRALQPFASLESNTAGTARSTPATSGAVSSEVETSSTNSVPKANSCEAEPMMDLAERRAKWARSAGMHLAGVVFELPDLDVMPLKTLRALCVQHKVLPACAVERMDFVRALTALVGVPAPGGQAREPAPASGASTTPSKPEERPRGPTKDPPRRDFSRFLGAAKPKFTTNDLELMPEQTLRTLCIQHGVLPSSGDVGRAELFASLAKIAVSVVNA